MRAIRISAYIQMQQPPTTVVVPEDAMTDTLESIRLRATDDLRGMLIVTDIFDAPDDAGMLEVTKVGMDRWSEADQMRESNMAVLYHWVVRYFTMTTRTGVIVTEHPAPLSSENVRLVLEQLGKHPGIGERTVVVTTEDMTVVILNGRDKTIEQTEA